MDSQEDCEETLVNPDYVKKIKEISTATKIIFFFSERTSDKPQKTKESLRNYIKFFVP